MIFGCARCKFRKPWNEFAYCRECLIWFRLRALQLDALTDDLTDFEAYLDEWYPI